MTYCRHPHSELTLNFAERWSSIANAPGSQSRLSLFGSSVLAHLLSSKPLSTSGLFAESIQHLILWVIRIRLFLFVLAEPTILLESLLRSKLFFLGPYIAALIDSSSKHLHYAGTVICAEFHFLACRTIGVPYDCIAMLRLIGSSLQLSSQRGHTGLEGQTLISVRVTSLYC
jgi:hypothetical protein